MFEFLKVRKYKMNSLLYYMRYFLIPMLFKIRLLKFINILLSIIEWKMKIIRPNSKPFIIRIEPSSICNLKCLSCKTPLKEIKYNQSVLMKPQEFNKIYNSISKYAFRMTFYMEGEPMTNPHLFDMIKIAGSNGVFTSFSTNFNLMKRESLKPLIDSKLDLLSICLDGYTQNAYKKYRVNGDVEKVKNGIKMVTQYKREHNLKYPRINIYTIMFSHVIPEIELIKSFCKQQNVDQLTFRPDESNLDGSYTYNSNVLPKSKCFWPWISISIDVDGSVYPCPVAFGHSDRKSYGNLLEMDLEEIWNNELYKETRKYLTLKSEKRENLDLKLPCYTCRWYKDIESLNLNV